MVKVSYAGCSTGLFSVISAQFTREMCASFVTLLIALVEVDGTRSVVVVEVVVVVVA